MGVRVRRIIPPIPIPDLEVAEEQEGKEGVCRPLLPTSSSCPVLSMSTTTPPIRTTFFHARSLRSHTYAYHRAADVEQDVKRRVAKRGWNEKGSWVLGL